MLFSRRYLSMSLKGYWKRMCNLAWKPRIWSIFTLQAAFGCFMNIYTKEILFPLRIWASRGATMLFRYLSVKADLGLGLVTYLIPFSPIPDLYMTSFIQTAEHKATEITVVFPFHGCVRVHTSILNKTGREIDGKTGAGLLFSFSIPVEAACCFFSWVPL